MRHFAILIGLSVAIVAISPTSSNADSQNTGGYAGGGAAPDGAQIAVVVPGSSSPAWPSSGYQPTTTPTSTGGNGSTASSNIECQYFNITLSPGAPLPGIGSRIDDTGAVADGTEVYIACRDTSTGATVYQNIFAWQPAAAGGPAPAGVPPLTPPAAVLAQMAANRVRLPLPGIRTWPPAGTKGLVNLPVWLHLDNWSPLSASASAGGLTATVEATPVRVRWAMDEGSVSCSSAGSVYDPVSRPDPHSSSCSYTYKRSSGVKPDLTYHDRATMFWHLRWTATNGEGGDLGELAGPASAFDLQIEESQALIVPNS